jgi:hypothetical protein
MSDSTSSWRLHLCSIVLRAAEAVAWEIATCSAVDLVKGLADIVGMGSAAVMVCGPGLDLDRAVAATCPDEF